MKDEEKNLIENLFHRLKNTELNSPQRDESADNLIQRLVEKQPVSSYYMVQTILIQETAIKKMNATIEELKKRIENLNKKSSNKPSFLSNFFSSNSDVQKKSHDSSNIWKHKDNPQKSYSSDPTISKTAQIPPNSAVTTTTKTSGFLSNALQTATGVAGGMILGNMLMNVFNHTKPEEEIFDNVDRSDLVNHDTVETVDYTTVDHDTSDSNSDNHLINNDELTNNNEDTDSNYSNSFNVNDANDDYDSDYDIDDDNFV